MSEHDGPLVIFKSEPEFWQLEYVGNKPNTVRLVDARDTKLDAARSALNFGEPATVEIINSVDGRIFWRRITDISQIGAIVGKLLWVISWRHEDGEGTYRDPEDVDE